MTGAEGEARPIFTVLGTKLRSTSLELGILRKKAWKGELDPGDDEAKKKKTARLNDLVARAWIDNQLGNLPPRGDIKVVDEEEIVVVRVTNPRPQFPDTVISVSREDLGF